MHVSLGYHGSLGLYIEYLFALCLFLTMQIFSDPTSSDAAIIDMVSNFEVFVIYMPDCMEHPVLYV